jgi:riboflavin synthase
MALTYPLDTAVFAQGWIGGQVGDLVEKMAVDQPVIAAQIEEQWKIVDTTMDELIRENRELNDKLNKVIDAAR